MGEIRKSDRPLCKGSYAGNCHVWVPLRTIANDPLPWWKKPFYETCYCMRCGAEKVRLIPEDYGL